MRKIFLLALILCFMGLSANTVNACLCEGISVKKKIKKLQKEADAIFIGKAKEVYKESDKGFSFRVTLQIEKSWKDVKNQEITVYTDGGCAAYFEVGKDYMVYAKADSPNRLWTDVCMRTRLAIYSDNDLKYLGKPKVVFKTESKSFGLSNLLGNTSHFDFEHIF